LQGNPKFELGIHPNFNSLLNNDHANGKNARQVIENLLKIVPNAQCLRSHSLVSSSKLLQMMPEYGLTHESNLFLPPESCNDLVPFRIWNGVIRIPHIYEDDYSLLSSENRHGSVSNNIIEYCKKNIGLRVLSFHPIHVFLNTENLDRYECTRKFHLHHEQLINYRYAGKGIRTTLESLLRIQ
jgi:hypothetical protein